MLFLAGLQHIQTVPGLRHLRPKRAPFLLKPSPLPATLSSLPSLFPKESALLLLLAILLHVQPVSAARSFVDIWDDAVPLLHEGVDIIASGEDPSERSWAEVLTFRDPKFQRIVSECFAILADSQALDLIASRDAARDEIAAKRQKIAALQQELVSAPSSHWNPLKATRSSLQEDIAGLRKEIADLEHGLEADKERIFAEISARGLPVSREQLETMLSAADGKDTASIMAA